MRISLFFVFPISLSSGEVLPSDADHEACVRQSSSSDWERCEKHNVEDITSLVQASVHLRLRDPSPQRPTPEQHTRGTHHVAHNLLHTASKDGSDAHRKPEAPAKVASKAAHESPPVADASKEESHSAVAKHEHVQAAVKDLAARHESTDKSNGEEQHTASEKKTQLNGSEAHDEQQQAKLREFTRAFLQILLALIIVPVAIATALAVLVRDGRREKDLAEADPTTDETNYNYLAPKAYSSG